MKTKTSVFVLLMVFIQTVSFTQEEGTVTIPAEDIPEKYVVKKGDTLWDISETFLKDPLEWPGIWKRNDFINDPHWIYPGQTLVFRLIPKTPVVEPPPTETTIKPLKQPEPLFIKSAPRISEVKPEAPVAVTPSIVSTDSREVIQTLRNPRPVFTEKSFMRTGFISRRSNLPKSKVTAIEGETSSATKYDMILIDSGGKDGVKEGDMIAALTIDDRVIHPDSGENLGVVVRVKGIVTVVSVGDNNARCRITESFDPIVENDLVMPARMRSGPLFDAWVKPEVVITGTILAINEPMLSIHLSDILYLDKGSEDGVLAGDRFAIYSRKHQLSQTGRREIIGELEAINVMPRETAVTVVSLKGERIEIGDRVELTARCRLVE